VNNNLLFKYNFIVVGYGYDYYDYVYRQLAELSFATFIRNWPFSPMAKRLFDYHYSFDLPLKKVWVRLYIHFLKKVSRREGFAHKGPTCFLLLAGGANNALLNYGLCEKIKESFVGSKVVFFINDLVAKTKQPVWLMKKHADLVYSFDPIDCQKYSLINHVIPYSNFSFAKNDNPEFDIVFVGAAKDRLNTLLSIYSYLTEKGVKCFFIIIGVPIEEQIHFKGVSYSSRVTYEENLRIIHKGNCILDVIQGDSSGNTIRVGEAIILGKKLLTNNRYTPSNGVFDKKNMRVFQTVDDIDIQFLLDKSLAIYDLREKMYPLDLLHSINEELANE
jgi:hypothetical protein